jgi:hypothetical protein
MTDDELWERLGDRRAPSGIWAGCLIVLQATATLIVGWGFLVFLLSAS